MSHYGVDVSSNNPHPIDWAAAFAALSAMGGGGRPFVIVKATQGPRYVNPDFAADVAGARAAGFAVGAYLMDEGSADPAAEQLAFERVAAGLPEGMDDELPDGLLALPYADHVLRLFTQDPGGLIYLNQAQITGGEQPPDAPLWLAEYNGQPGVTRWPAAMHQYSDLGRVAGIGGAVDLDFWCGSEEAFAAFFGLAAPAIATEEEDMANVQVVEADNGLYVVNWDAGTKFWIPTGPDGSVIMAKLGQTGTPPAVSAAQLDQLNWVNPAAAHPKV